MLRTRFLPAGLLALILVAAACSSGTSATPSASASASAMDSVASESAAASESASASDALPSIDLPSEAADLEDILPDEIGGEPVQKFSMTGDSFLSSGQGDEEFAEFLERLDADASDVSVAFAFTMSEASSGVFAFRVAGASQDQLLDEFEAASDDAGDTSGWSDATVGGKQVRTAVQEDEDVAMYLYPRDDIIFIVTAASEDAAADALAALP